jgi:hypothetical protein
LSSINITKFGTVLGIWLLKYGVRLYVNQYRVVKEADSKALKAGLRADLGIPNE